MNEENAANRLTLICINLPDIRARANTLTSTPYDPSLIAEAKAVMDLAEMVDLNLQQWYQTLPTEWQYRTVGMTYELPDDISEAESWLGPQHAYHDVPVANLINDYRVCRIFCQRVIIACVTWLSLGDTGTQNHESLDTYQKAVFVIQQMVDEISAGVPFHMNYDMQPVAQELGQERNGERKNRESALLQVLTTV
jgi:hypothetical protein